MQAEIQSQQAVQLVPKVTIYGLVMETAILVIKQ